MERTVEQLERIRDFVAALRSGEYAQCSSYLSVTQDEAVSYCCQGVALLRYGAALGYLVTRTPEGFLHGRDPNVVGSIGTILTAPGRFWHDMGLSEDPGSGFILNVNERGHDVPAYSDLNDSGFTFDQIADLIEWQFLSSTEEIA